MRRLTRIFLNVLIVFYLSVIYFTGVPETNTLTFRLKQQTQKVAFALGIWPSWSMFAPNPIKFDSKSYVEITYKNGEIKEYDVEKQVDGILGPFRKARWMKYSQDNLRNPNQRGLLRPAIKYFARKYRQENNPIVNVKLKRKWKEVHPFSDHSIPSISNTPRTERNEVLISQNLER
ncbi:MAG: hypothetical protein ACLGHN_03470 [Bacteriovoracia bacterium]